MDKRLFTIYYTDGTYLSYRLTEEEYREIGRKLGKDENVFTEIGFLRTADMRSIIVQKELRKEEFNKSANPGLTKEEEEYLKSIKLAAEALEDIKQDMDDEIVEGGMIDGN